MSRGFSIYLDLLRFGAAFVVLLSHFAYPRFSEGRWLWVRDWNLGSDAVIVFFVMSGFVIALVTARKDSGIGGFAFDRASRLLSVALPALVIGWALDRAGAAIAPVAYEGWWYNPLPLWEQVLRGASFSNEWAGMATRLGTNGPYWSLSYEAAFYALFAVAFYMRGARRAALLLAGLVVFGLNIVLLMPAWLMGVWLHARLVSGPQGRASGALVLAVLPVIAYMAARAAGVPEALRGLSAPVDAVLVLRFSDEPLWNALLGALVTLHLLGMAQLLSESSLARWRGPAAWLAGGSFSLYLIHYPLLQFFGALMPRLGPDLLRDGVLLTLVGAACFIFAAAFERPLPRLRAALRGVRFRKMSAAPPHAPRAGG